MFDRQQYHPECRHGLTMWFLLITADMVNIIVRKTNEKAAQLHQKSVKNIQIICGIGKK
ncbi:hypothetical protein T02_13740 [Trichinella nativa]|uniref:Uncharacterized protein n=1 Tax=Trichinella nativa TaxID=6335 RepID=A0A0V1KJ57_9BILA|nr:hypothetical protein T02_13740 [Trichinella nativa]